MAPVGATCIRFLHECTRVHTRWQIYTVKEPSLFRIPRLFNFKIRYLVSRLQRNRTLHIVSSYRLFRRFGFRDTVSTGGVCHDEVAEDRARVHPCHADRHGTRNRLRTLCGCAGLVETCEQHSCANAAVQGGPPPSQRSHTGHRPAERAALSAQQRR